MLAKIRQVVLAACASSLANRLTTYRKAAITAKPAQSAVATLHLGPTSTSSRLSTFELGASLGHALVSASLETWRVMLAAPVSGGAAAPQTTIRAQDMRPAGFELEDEVRRFADSDSVRRCSAPPSS